MRFLFAGLTMCLATSLAAHPTPGLKYLNEGGRISVQRLGDAQSDSQFAIASVGKIFTSIAIAQLVDRGQISFDDPLSDFLPDHVLGPLSSRDVTLTQALTMTSGIPDYLDDAFIDDVVAGLPETQSVEGALGYAHGQRPQFAPGQGFDYSNSNFLLLELVIEQVGGRPYAAVIEDDILNPFGLTNSFVFGTRPLPARFVTGHQNGAHVRDYYNGRGFGDGAVISTAGDIAKLYRALLIDGRILRPKTLDQFLQDPSGEGYAMGIEVEGDILGHSGGDHGFSSDIRINRATGDIAVILLGDGDADTDWTYQVLE